MIEFKEAKEAYERASSLQKKFKKSIAKNRTITDEFNLEEIIFLTYTDAIPADLSYIIKEVGEGKIYLVEYPQSSFKVFQNYTNRYKFAKELSKQTKIPALICDNLHPVFENNPLAVFPCASKEKNNEKRDKVILSYILAYAATLPKLSLGKSFIYVGGKIHAEFFVNNVLDYAPNFKVTHQKLLFLYKNLSLLF